MIELMLFGTEACHLCEEAELIIQQSQYENKLILSKIDIAQESDWYEQYAIHIPVLLHTETNKELFWPFDHQQFCQYMEQL